MPGIEHEALVELFRSRPSLAAELLKESFGVELAFDAAETRESTLTALPTEYRADHVVVLQQAGNNVAAVIVEVQLGDARDKYWKWPAYVAVLRARLHCDVHLAIVTTDEKVAHWASQPIRGPCMVVQPWVFGPNTIPHVTDPARALQQPELSVLSALTHGHEADALDIAAAALFGIHHLDPDHQRVYSDLVYAALPTALIAALETKMKTAGYEPKTEFLRLEYRRGKAEGKHDALLAILGARDITLTEDDRARIEACIDGPKLDAMITRAATARSVGEVLGDG